MFYSPITTRLVGEGSGEEVKPGGEETIVPSRELQAGGNLMLELEGNVVRQA